MFRQPAGLIFLMAQNLIEMNNLQIIQQMYQDFEEKNMAAVLNCFDKDVVWIRPGEPGIPFSGIYNGIDEVVKMFTIVSQTVKINSFNKSRILADDEVVAVIGADMADVIATGKSYKSEWVYLYTLKNEKIVHVQVYIDTLELTKAFQP